MLTSDILSGRIDRIRAALEALDAFVDSAAGEYLDETLLNKIEEGAKESLVKELKKAEGELTAIETEKTRLESAAPDLLYAARERLAEWHSDARNMKRHEPQSVRLAREAIAKAEGKQ